MLLSAFLTTILAASDTNVLVKTYGTFCAPKDKQTICTTIIDLRNANGRVFTAIRRCNLTEKTCKITGVDK